MPALLTLDAVCATTPDGRPLFQDLTLSIGTERIGLVGRNGSGKSTALAMAAGLAAPLSGTVRRSGTLGLLQQDMPSSWTVAEALGVAPAMAVLGRILEGTGSADDHEAADWTLEARIGAALAAVALPALPLDRRLDGLSGGERVRVGIARLLIEPPDLLILDEPTNNLDAAGRAAIDALVRGWRGGVLLASHDRSLLEGMDHIVELTAVGVRVFGGGWSAFVVARNAERALAAAELERGEAGLRAATRMAQMQREAKERRDRAGRSEAARGSQPNILLGKRAERAENSGGRTRALGARLVADAMARAADARARVEVLTPLTITLPPSGLANGAELLDIRDAAMTLGERMLGPWTLHITGPERVALTGRNGVGKTTLLRIAAGLLAPSQGMARRAEGRIALLDQRVSLLDPEASVLDNIRRRHPALSDEEAHAACARFAFRNRDADRLAGTLSGGERLRAGLAVAFSAPRAPWLVILDEPTNHLDIESIEILEEALRRFDGALLIASHDPRFLERIVVERVVAV